jgi:hypothetical protein
MLTVIDNSLNRISFTELGPGATFKFDDHYYMVIETISTHKGYRNAVRLDDGLITMFDDSDMVIPFNCELIVL